MDRKKISSTIDLDGSRSQALSKDDYELTLLSHIYLSFNLRKKIY